MVSPQFNAIRIVIYVFKLFHNIYIFQNNLYKLTYKTKLYNLQMGRVNIIIVDDLHKKLKVACALEDKTIQDYINDLLQKKLKK